jgi:hypothetical protein
LTTLTIDARQSRPGTAAEVSHRLLRFDFARLVGMPILQKNGWKNENHGIFMEFSWDFHGIFMGFSWDFHGIFMGFHGGLGFNVGLRLI